MWCVDDGLVSVATPLSNRPGSLWSRGGGWSPNRGAVTGAGFGYAADPMNFLRCRISWSWLAIPAAVFAFCLAVLWWVGRDPVTPAFRLDTHDGNHVVPIDWPWWRQLADRLHGRRYIVLTFDDGPAGGGVDERILAALRRDHAKAMFFFICKRITPARVHLLGEIRAEGSVIENHSYSHPHLTTLTADALRHQVDGCSDKLKSIDGRRPDFFRPPFGQTSAQVRADVRAADMREVQWSANSFDVVWHRPAKIARWAEQQAYNGAILLMHSRQRTARALPTILARLHADGYRFVLPQPTSLPSGS